VSNRIVFAVIVLSALAGGGWWGYRQWQAARAPQQKARAEAAPVTIAPVVRKAMPQELRLFGTVEAFSTVAIKSQISGILTKVAVDEGQDVKAGDLMFTIDVRPAQAAQKQAEANLARAQVQRDNAKKELDRQAELRKKGVASENDYDQAQTTFAAMSATVMAEEAALENAKLQVEYCTIRAPLAGRIGELKVQEGNLVKANDISLATINQIKPIKVAFAAPQKEQPEIMRQMAKGPLEVRAYLPNLPDLVETGRLVFVNNQVDTRTGTIQLKGDFDNARDLLWPGQFVNVVLQVLVLPEAVVAPTRAVVTGQNGTYVFVLKPDQTVEMRPVTVVRTADEDALIGQGLKPDEQVVTDGQLRLVPGARVKVKNPANAAEAKTP
jgi:multidrug efflux system membrane fusion protein